MSIADEARVEAERRYALYRPVTNQILESGFVAGAEWLASRKVEVTDDMVEKACAGFYESTDGLTSWRFLSENDPALADKYRVFMRVALSAALGGGGE